MQKLIPAAVAIILCQFLFSCSKTESIRIAGSTTVLPVVSKAAEHFRMNHPQVNVIVNAGGSGVGINQLGEGKVEIGMASRDLPRTEIEKYPQVEFVTHTIGRDAVVPVVSSEVYAAGVHVLSVAQIAGIYRGTIRKWQQVGGPNREILVVDKERSRGTRHVFMQAVFGDKEAEAPGADLVLGSNNEEQTAITQSDAAIGMLSHAWLNQDIKGVSLLMDEGAVIEPTLANIVSGAFPITRALLLITNGQPRGLTKSFIDFVLSPEGQGIVEEAGYVRIN